MNVMQGYRQLFKGIVLLSCLGGLAGCGVGSRVGDHMDGGLGDLLFTRDKQLNVQLKGDDKLNPDQAGQPLSVEIRIYQLNAINTFRNADMSALWADGKKVLGDTLLSERTVTLVPNGTLTDSSKLSAEAQYIGVAAFFRSSAGATWHVAMSAQDLRKDGILFSSEGVQLTLKGNRIEVVRGKDVLVPTAAKAKR